MNQIVQKYGRYAAIAAILIEYLAIVYFVFIAEQSLALTRPISDFGSMASTQLIFSIGYSLAAVLFVVFGLWLSSQLSLHKNFKTAVYVAAISQTLASWLPNLTPGIISVLHYVFAVVLMLSLPTIVYYYISATKKSLVRSTSWVIFWVELVAIFLVPLSIVKGVPLLPELLVSISFQLWAVLATFEDKL